MKIHKLLYSGFIVTSIVFLAACQADNQADPNGKIETTTQSNQTKAVESHTLADQTAYQGAQELKDPTFCDKIENEDYKKQCKTELTDQIQMEAAVAKASAEDCKKISTADKQKACELQVEIKLKQKQQSQELQSSYDKFNQLSAEGDYEKCKTLQDSNLLTACEENILTNKALNTKDKNWCEKISAPPAQQRCLDAVKSFTNK